MHADVIVLFAQSQLQCIAYLFLYWLGLIDN